MDEKNTQPSPAGAQPEQSAPPADTNPTETNTAATNTPTNVANPPAPTNSIAPATEFAPDAAAQPTAPTAPVANSVAPASVPPQSPPPKKSRKKLLLLIFVPLLALLLLAGAAAAAYFGYVVPNKPENKLARAVTNTLEQEFFTVEGNFDIKPKTEGEVNAVALDYTLAADAEAKALSLEATIGVSGAQFPVEARYLDQEAYFKVSGLDKIAELGGAFADAETKQTLEMLSGINNQWYVLDRSFMNESPEFSCIADLDFRLSDDDKQKLKDAYAAHPLFTIKRSESAKVGDQDATKFEVEPASDQTARAFIGELETLGFMQKLQDCVPGSEGSSEVLDQEIRGELEALQREAVGTMAIYVADDLIKKVEITGGDAEASYELTATLQYSKPTITKPEGAKPIQDLIGELYGGFMAGFAGSGFGGTGSPLECEYDQPGGDVPEGCMPRLTN